MAGKYILFADDEEKIRQIVKKYLERDGYQVEVAVDGEDALQLFRQRDWDMIILDIMMPKLDGMEVCREIRRTSQVPVIMLTARNDEIDRVLGLEIGADDYVGKPFSPRELMARIKAILRRTEIQPVAPQTVISFPGISIDLITRAVIIADNEIYLTPKEFDLLVLMAGQPGRAFTREQLLENIWGTDYYGDLRTVDTHVKRLREKLKITGVPQYINTVWGIGYKFEVSKG